MPEIDASYWAFAFTQTLLMMTAAVAGGLNIVWYARIWAERPPLRELVLFIALLHLTLGIEATRWVVDRALDPAFAVAVAAAILESSSYWGYVAVRAAFLTLAGAQTLILWRSRDHSMARFMLLAAVIVALAVAATSFHHRQVESFCRDPPGCRVD